jgi:hypothetical protein
MSSRESLQELRKQLVDALRGHQAHIDFDSAVKDFPAAVQGVRPAGAPHSAWQLLEHLRIAQHDILEFSRNSEYKSPSWPEGYWPETEAPPDPDAWSKSVKSFQKDARELVQLLNDPQADLFKAFEHGDGQTLLREALLTASHNSYHLGQLIFLKKMILGDKH